MQSCNPGFGSDVNKGAGDVIKYERQHDRGE